jgi:hypothetical protein
VYRWGYEIDGIWTYWWMLLKWLVYGMFWHSGEHLVDIGEIGFQFRISYGVVIDKFN